MWSSCVHGFKDLVQPRLCMIEIVYDCICLITWFSNHELALKRSNLDLMNAHQEWGFVCTSDCQTGPRPHVRRPWPHVRRRGKKIGFHSVLGRSSGHVLPLEQNWAARAAKVCARAATPVSAYAEKLWIGISFASGLCFGCFLILKSSRGSLVSNGGGPIPKF
mgnify:CR=1 FL=1